MEKMFDCKKILSNCKVRFWEEYLPLFFIALSDSLTLFASLYLPLLMILVFLFFKWQWSIIIWILYYLWIWYDSPTLKTAGRKIHQVKCFLAFDCVRQYFPIQLMKTATLPADRNYFFACYPHGVIPRGLKSNVFPDGKFTELFPNIEVHVTAMAFFFQIPLVREYLMAIGYCPASLENIKYWLNCEPSKAIIVFPGGRKDMYVSHPGTEYKIHIHRKGFIKIALQTGVSLVPVFSFGEINSQDQEECKTGVGRFIMNLAYKYTKFNLPRIIGRGIFQKKFGTLPHPRPITTVVGKPIPVPKVENPTAALIDEYHEKFFTALYELFESHKHTHDEAGSCAKLIMTGPNYQLTFNSALGMKRHKLYNIKDTITHSYYFVS